MPSQIASLVVGCLGVYLAIGAAFAPFFAWRGVGRIDPAARRGSLGFRLLILPGAVALWPLMLRRWLAGVPAAAPDSAHDAPAKGGRR